MENVGRTMEFSLEDEFTLMQREAAKQLRTELAMIKSRVLMSGTLMNSILVVQLKMVIRGLLKKYNDAGMLVGENITLVVNGRGRHASFGFAYSQNLQQLITEVETEAMSTIKNQTNEEETK